MSLVSPLETTSQRQPFDDDARMSVDDSSPTLRGCFAGEVSVRLNIYDVSHDSTIHQINQLFANSWSPMKFGGLFHVGIEILSAEWSYGWVSAGSGVISCVPRCDRQHHYRETVHLPNTTLSEEEVKAILRRLWHEYRGEDYHLTDKNCCKFAEDLCERLGVGPIPAWIQRMGEVCGTLMRASSFAGMHLSCGSASKSPAVASRPAESSYSPLLCRVEDEASQAFELELHHGDSRTRQVNRSRACQPGLASRTSSLGGKWPRSLDAPRLIHV